ncbi:hypothetical protein PGB90_001935 [Kerria lacca]
MLIGHNGELLNTSEEAIFSDESVRPTNNTNSNINSNSSNISSNNSNLPAAPCLNHQQLVMLQNLQQNARNLTPPQQILLQQLQHQYSLMHQHLQQVKLQQQQKQLQQTKSPNTVSTNKQDSVSAQSSPLNVPNYQQNQSNTSVIKQFSQQGFNGDVTSTFNIINTHADVQSDNSDYKSQNSTSQSTYPLSDFDSQLNFIRLNDCDIKLSSTADVGVSDQELQALLSQKDIATSLAEDLLKHFGSPSVVDDIDIKDELGFAFLTRQRRLYNESNNISSSTYPPQSVQQKNVLENSDDCYQVRIKAEPRDIVPKEITKEVEYSIEITAKQIVESCKGKVVHGVSNGSILYDDKGPPPSPPDPPPQLLTKEQLLPPTPSIYLDNKKQAFSPQLQEFCLKHPIAIVRGIAAALKLGYHTGFITYLGLFLTKTLVEANPDHLIEVRTQVQQSGDENWDQLHGRKGWACISHRSHTTIAKYAQYQASSFQDSLKEEREKITENHLSNTQVSLSNQSDSDSKDSTGNSVKRKKGASFSVPGIKPPQGSKMLRFGTNDDLSDNQEKLNRIRRLLSLH